MTHPWSSSVKEFEQTTMPKLLKIGKNIGDSAASGNETAKKIIEYYIMIKRSFDPMTHFLLTKEIKAWETETK
jgi:hypothetical protein